MTYDTAADEAIFTYGWDTAFAIPLREVNRAIVARRSSPQRMLRAEASHSVVARFGDWQVCQGGAGQVIRLRLPLCDGRLVFKGTGQSIHFDSAEAVVEVALHYQPQGTLPGPDGARPYALKVNPQPGDRPAMRVLDLKTHPALDPLSNALVQQALADWGARQLDEFDHLFCVVDLDRQVNQERWGYVTPHVVSYAYVDRETEAESLLAVLCMTGSRTGEDATRAISPLAIPRGSARGFLINQTRVLYDLVRPAIMQAFPGLDDLAFLMNEDATELYLAERAAPSLEALAHQGMRYYPQLTQLHARCAGHKLALTSQVRFELSPGVMGLFRCQHSYRLGLLQTPGGQSLSFQQAGPAQIELRLQQAEGSQISSATLALSQPLQQRVLQALTERAEAVLGGTLAGLMLGADQMHPAWIAKVNRPESPPIDLLLAQAVRPIHWATSTAYKVNYAGLNRALQLGASPALA